MFQLKKLWISDPNDNATPKTIIYSAIVAIATAAILWGIWPGAGYRPSTNPEIWNFFGAYMSGVAGPLVNLATLWMLYVTVHQARKVNATQEEQLKQAASAVSADQRDRTFNQLVTTQRELLAQIGVNDAAKPDEAHPWRGVDGLLHLLNEAESLSQDYYVTFVGRDADLCEEATYVAYAQAVSWNKGIQQTRQPGTAIADLRDLDKLWKEHMPKLDEPKFAKYWKRSAEVSMDNRASAYDHQLDTYHRHLAYMSAWVSSLSDAVAREQLQQQLGSQISWVEFVFIKHRASRPDTPYAASAIQPLLSQWTVRPSHAVAKVVYESQVP